MPSRPPRKHEVGFGVFGVEAAGAMVLAIAAVGGSMAFFILVLDSWMPAWLAALIVTAGIRSCGGGAGPARL